MIHRIGDRRATAHAVPLPPQLELEACYRYCEALCRAHHHNFPVASIFARSNLRQHIFAIFAFARVADDFADEPAYEGRRARELDRWEELLHQTYFGRPPEHPVFVALAATIKALALLTGLSRGTLHQLESGQAHVITRTLERVCRSFGISMTELFAEAERRRHR